MNWSHALSEVVALPREEQLEALRRLHSSYPAHSAEAWNTAFNGESLYAAWTTIPLLQDLYRHNRTVIRPLLDQCEKWHIVEIGGGNGALWRDFLHPDERGYFTLVDPDPGAHRAVASTLPKGIAFDSIVAPVEAAELPAANLVVCSLALHHIAGRDTAERQAHGLSGPGKCELLARFVEAVRSQRGRCILNEADVYAEIDRTDLDPAARQKLETILLYWFVDQPERAGCAPLAARDVYELDVAHWLELLARAGTRVDNYRCTDVWGLFYQYVFSPA